MRWGRGDDFEEDAAAFWRDVHLRSRRQPSWPIPSTGEETIVYGDLDLSRIPEEQAALDVVGHYNRADIFTFAVDERPRRSVAWRRAAGEPAETNIAELEEPAPIYLEEVVPVPVKVDLNADMGESFGRWTLGNDSALMPHLTSANIACGFHGGEPHVMRQTVALAIEHGVGFGPTSPCPTCSLRQRRIAVSPQELHDYVLYQAGAMAAFAEAAEAASST